MYRTEFLPKKKKHTIKTAANGYWTRQTGLLSMAAYSFTGIYSIICVMYKSFFSYHSYSFKPLYRSYTDKALSLIRAMPSFLYVSGSA
jgi:hypothetical protein